MKINKIIALLSIVILGACSTTSTTLFGGSDDKKTGVASKNNATGFDGTFINNKITNFKSEQEQLKKLVDSRKATLQSMRDDTNTGVSDYRTAVAQINSKLQLGTTPGNPQLMDEWKTARAKLEKVNNIAFDIQRLVGDVESDQSMVNYMVGSIQASYNIRGASEEEHKQLKVLEEEAKQIGSSIAIFSRQLGAEADRQQNYVDAEKFNLNDVALNIKNGKLYGVGGSTDFFADGGSMFSSDDSYDAFISETVQDYGMDPRMQPRQSRSGRQQRRQSDRQTPVRGIASLVASPALVESTTTSSSRPLIVIKFDKDTVDFEEPLYQSLSRALERNPSATFEVSGIDPRMKSNNTVKKNVKDVMMALTEMGLPASRVAITMQTDDVMFDEVRVYEK